jgi:ABC-type amino acid transport substrate-binding protein
MAPDPIPTRQGVQRLNHVSRRTPPNATIALLRHTILKHSGLFTDSPARGLRHLLALTGLLLLLLVSVAQAQPPLREVRVGTKEAPPFAMKAPDGTWSGISIELWSHIAEKLGLHATFREYESVPDMLRATADGTLDAAISAITVTSEREQSVDFTQPFYASGLGIAVPMQKEIEWLPILRSFFTVRFAQAIGVLVAAATTVGAVIWLFERHHTEHFAGGSRGLGTGLWWSASAMTQTAASDKAPATLLGRAMAIAWMIASVIIIASFTAGITSQLTAKQIAERVRGPSDLTIVRTGSVAATAALEYLRTEHISARVYDSAETGLEALKQGKLDAFVYDKPLLTWTARKDFLDEVEVLDTLFDHQNYAIALPAGSELRTRINVAMIDGLREPWWKDVLVRYLGRD